MSIRSLIHFFNPGEKTAFYFQELQKHQGYYTKLLEYFQKSISLQTVCIQLHFDSSQRVCNGATDSRSHNPPLFSSDWGYVFFNH